MTNNLSALNLKKYKELEPNHRLTAYPEKVLQFGDGNFIRGFVDWMIYEMNLKGYFQGKVVSIQATPRGKTTPKLNRQNGLFTLLERGIENGEQVERKHLVDSIHRGINPYTHWSEVLMTAESPDIQFVFSNTTEAGLQYKQEEFSKEEAPLSFPGKLVALLHHRYLHFEGCRDKGWIVIPCELIENNGDELKGICLRIAEDWGLSLPFKQWLDEACVFCNTLVDRIVPGYPKNEDEKLFAQLGYTDELLTVAEPYHLFVIDGPAFIEEKLPFKAAGLNVQFDQITSYRELKVKLLNAPHTILAATGLLSKVETVRECMEHGLLFPLVSNALVEEVIPTLSPSEQAKAEQYAMQVFDRFRNPYLHHRLADISLNSYSKFKARVWPIIEAYRLKYGKNPNRLTFAFASLLYFFKGTGHQNVKDDMQVLKKFQSFNREFDGTQEMLVKFIEKLIREDMLCNDEEIHDLCEDIAEHYLHIHEKGAVSALLAMEAEGDL